MAASQHFWCFTRLRANTFAITTHHPQAMLRRRCSHIAAERVQGRLGIITLDRPAKLNALSLQMIRDMHKVYKNWLIEDPLIKCIVIRGASGKAFCAGGDVTALREARLAGDTSLPFGFMHEEYPLNHLISRLWDRHGIAQIAVWDGVTMGGGIGISAYGKFRIVTERTLWAMPETAIGLCPDVGSSHLLPRVTGGLPMGLYVGMTGVRLRAADLLHLGLATHYVPSSNLHRLLPALAELGDAVGDEKAVAATIQDIGEGTAPEQEHPLRGLEETVTRCFSAPTVEEVFERLQVEEGSSSGEAAWAKQTLETLRRMSPTALKVTFEAFRQHAAADCTLGAALQMEYRLCSRAVTPEVWPDFFEGIRAVLVEKDPSSVAWSPPSLEQVSRQRVESYFAPLSTDHPLGELVLPDE